MPSRRVLFLCTGNSCRSQMAEAIVNATYVVDILSHLDAEEAVFRFSSTTRAGIVAPSGPREGEDVLMLVMPVRLNA